MVVNLALAKLVSRLNRQPSKCEYEPLIDRRLEAQLLAVSYSVQPEGQARWSLRLLADRLVEVELTDSVSHETVRRTLKNTNSNPEKNSRYGCVAEHLIGSQLP